jgi:hypothetical protein
MSDLKGIIGLMVPVSTGRSEFDLVRGHVDARKIIAVADGVAAALGFAHGA